VLKQRIDRTLVRLSTTRIDLPRSEGIASIEASEGKVHLTCKDVSV